MFYVFINFILTYIMILKIWNFLEDSFLNVSITIRYLLILSEKLKV